ncbi:uncharacterized protein VTP21DRAFT_11056 [Calcarisporiella thermophila]|uniref:uncharacterized protein n=1 Tax=Calcarisporiella thermophila TaxID=911321 RepID=UPI003743E732
MALHYQLVFTLLVLEMAAFVFFVLPLPLAWRRATFRWMSNSPMVGKVVYSLKIMFVFVLILFIDSINRMLRANGELARSRAEGVHHAHSENHHLITTRLYSQRNFYLCGFTLFLSLILVRTYQLVMDFLKSEEKVDALRKQLIEKSKECDKLQESKFTLQEKIDHLEKDLSVYRVEEKIINEDKGDNNIRMRNIKKAD